MAPSRLNLPNAITVARIAATPFIAWLALSSDNLLRYCAFALFLVAALSDLWDGYLARKYELITDLGKLLDPLADKLLLVATLVPIFLLSRRGGDFGIPFWGAVPVWVLVVIFGREAFITWFRGWAARRGRVIAAGKSGKYKALLQNVFVGAALLWFPLVSSAASAPWSRGELWEGWKAVHGLVLGLTLALAVFLTVYSLVDYLWSYRSELRANG